MPSRLLRSGTARASTKKRKRYFFREGQRVEILRDLYRLCPKKRPGEYVLYCSAGEQGVILNIDWKSDSSDWHGYYKVKLQLDSGLVRNVKMTSIKRI